MKKINIVEIEGEKIHLRKDFLGWHVVYPVTNENYKSIRDCLDWKIWVKGINWTNLLAGGNWKKLIIIGVFVIILIGAIVEVSNLKQIATTCLNSPIGKILK